jgi:hypothetical protein
MAVNDSAETLMEDAMAWAWQTEQYLDKLSKLNREFAQRLVTWQLTRRYASDRPNPAPERPRGMTPSTAAKIRERIANLMEGK